MDGWVMSCFTAVTPPCFNDFSAKKGECGPDIISVNNGAYTSFCIQWSGNEHWAADVEQGLPVVWRLGNATSRGPNCTQLMTHLKGMMMIHMHISTLPRKMQIGRTEHWSFHQLGFRFGMPDEWPGWRKRSLCCSLKSAGVDFPQFHLSIWPIHSLCLGCQQEPSVSHKRLSRFATGHPH